MCGIVGIYAYADSAGDPDDRELNEIRDHMRARGPDAASSWRHASGRVAFGHRRLSIIDLSERATQPMASAEGAEVIVFNGEIYNYPELKAELERDGHRFRTNSDTEVLLQLYQSEGAAMVRRLRGMFAFAIWDERHGGLFLARDPYGIKPLYWSAAGGTFRFASQVKALQRAGALSHEPDPAGLVGFHLLGYVPEPFTTLRAISSLPAGTTLWVDRRGVAAPQAYASIAEELWAPPRQAFSEGDLQRHVRGAVLDSVRAHLVADVEVGAFLSAGIDSGALVGLMRDAGQSRIRTVTLRYDEYAGKAEDEALLAERVAEQFGAQHVTRVVRREEFITDLPHILAAMDQPSIDGVNTWFVSKACRELGLKVAISGVGGDELLGGYSSFRDVPRWRAWLGPFAALPGAASLWRGMAGAVPGLRKRSPKIPGLLDYPRSWAGAYFLKRALLLPEELDGVLDPTTIRDGLGRLDLLGLIDGALHPDPGTAMGRVVALESGNYMRSQLLRDTDWAGMAHSLEIRTPLVDFTLLKAMAPWIPHLKGRSGKLALAAAPSRPLPASVTDRAKTGFGIPLMSWLTGEVALSAGQASRQWAQRVLATGGGGQVAAERLAS